MQKKLSKAGIDVHDHSSKAAIDGARLTGKDRSLEDVRRRLLSNAEHKREELSRMDKPLMRKEGLDFHAGDNNQRSMSFPPVVLCGGEYRLHRILSEKGRDGIVLYIPQEYTCDDKARIFSEVSGLSDDEKGQLLSDLYRLGAEPSFLLDDEKDPSPGEMKKLDFALSRRNGKSIIIMDEPTNHLDIVSMKIFERIFGKDDDSYTLILVSHDKAFLDATCTEAWHIERNGSEGHLIIS